MTNYREHCQVSNKVVSITGNVRLISENYDDSVYHLVIIKDELVGIVTN